MNVRFVRRGKSNTPASVNAAWLIVLLVTIPAEAQPTANRAVSALENYLNMAGSRTAKDFRPLTRDERIDLYLKSLVNPWGFAKAAASGAIDHLRNKPEEWGQGWGPYGERVANVEGQYLVQKTVTYLISAPLHEDNRYFGSGKHGVWPRVGYALETSLMARHDNGNLYVSVSQLTGVAAGAFAARLWLPPSQKDAGNAAISFGITMGANAGFSVVKEFLPDIVRRVRRDKTGNSTVSSH
jgi:hypothetical protein